MLGTTEEFVQSTKRLQGRRVRILGDHPFSGYSAYVVSLDKIGMKVRLIGADAMDGHESYIMEKKHYRAGRIGLVMDPNLLYDQCQQAACRSYIPEDSARDLFLKLYDLLVFASATDRHKAVRMLVAAYDLPDVG